MRAMGVRNSCEMALDKLFLRGNQPLDAFGHAVEGLGERSESAAAHRWRTRLEKPLAESAGGLAHGFQVAPDGVHPEPD
jgi:hypothetical protein